MLTKKEAKIVKALYTSRNFSIKNIELWFAENEHPVNNKFIADYINDNKLVRGLDDKYNYDVLESVYSLAHRLFLVKGVV